MSITTFGTITICDVTDIGEFSVYPMANLPLSVIYDPDQSSFTPNWGTSNLVLTPVVYYAGTRLTLGSTGLSVTWQRQEGISGATNLTTGETNNNGVLTVNQNKFTANSTMLTYIVTAEYVEPTSQQTLTSQGQITFTLNKMASSVKSCSITGESIFKYNSSQSLVGSSSITLTATVTNVSISQWQYKNSSGNWVQYPSSGTGTTLTVNATHSTFVNNVCTVKLTTSDANVYDIHVITKLYDGAPGSGTIAAVLTNEDQMIPMNSQGVPTSYSGATSRIIVYEGGSDVTSSYTISTTSDQNITFTRSSNAATNDTVTVTGMSGSAGNIYFTATKGTTTLNKTFSLIGIQGGADGVTPTIYSLDASTYAMNKNISNVLTPSSVKFYAYQQTGGSKTEYSGRFKIFENISLAEYDAASPKPSAAYTSTSNESTHSYTPSSSATSILCLLFQGGGTTTRYDAQSVVITSDGQTGQQGPQGQTGASAINVILGNYADVIPCTSANKPAAQTTITIPFSAYEGTTRIAVTCTSPPKLLGVTATNTAGTASSDGSLVYVLPTSTSVSAATGTLSLSFSCKGNTIVKEYRWTRSTAATNGEDAVFLQLYSPNGYIFENGGGTLTIEGVLTKGSTDVTSSVTTWKWEKYVSGTWTTVSGATTRTLSVNGNTVDGYACYRCTATYSSKNYIQYYSLMDKTDPLQCTVLSSVGSQILNGQGVGALYVRVTQNGYEIDNMNTEVFSENPPANPSSGDYYYALDKTNKTVTLKKYNGSSWATQSETWNCTYTWYFRDKDGNRITPAGLSSSGKIIYIDGTLIDKKLTADVEVTL